MKRFLMIAVLAAAVVALLAGTALAAPGNPPTQGLGYGARMQAQDPATGTCGMVGGAGAAGGMMGRGAPAWAGEPEELVTLLGMEAEEIQAQRQAGTSLAAIAASKNVTVDQLVDTLMAAKKDTLALLVADGKLTQDQANLMLERMETQVTSMVTRTTTGAPAERGMGMGMRGGGRGFNR